MGWENEKKVKQQIDMKALYEELQINHCKYVNNAYYSDGFMIL